MAANDRGRACAKKSEPEQADDEGEGEGFGFQQPSRHWLEWSEAATQSLTRRHRRELPSIVALFERKFPACGRVGQPQQTRVLAANTAHQSIGPTSRVVVGQSCRMHALAQFPVSLVQLPLVPLQQLFEMVVALE